ncbi:ATP-binding protein [Fusobacterium nucleatum]|uniref:ATP-binding protein n=1 Tax=Fusobacterium nucleatum TaxID=851 RepID=UPI0030D5BAB3
MFSREIGRVISVDSFKIMIELDENIKGTHKSGYYDIYEVAKVNSYVIVPIGSDKIVALITRVKTFEDSEIEKSTGGIRFSKSKRHLIATMLGTITEENKYEEGIYNYPVLDNPVWYIIKEDLEKIFDSSSKKDVDCQKDFYLPIGKNGSFKDYDIKINPDKFFTKHSAILGNTGSGKSCTVTSILQSLFNYNYSRKSDKEDKLKNATIIIFDTNGEYKSAFKGYENINAFTISEEGMKVPYWFMNYEDFEYLFEPSAGTQVPILKKALGLLKNEKIVELKEKTKEFDIEHLLKLKNICSASSNTRKEYIFYQIESYSENDIVKNNKQLEELISSIAKEKNQWMKLSGTYINGDVSLSLFRKLDEELNKVLEKLFLKETRSYQNIDLPKFFDFSELIEKGLDKAIESIDENKNRYREYVSSLKLRLASFMSDMRKAEPLIFNENSLYSDEKINNYLEIFFKYIFGDKDMTDGNLFSEYKKKNKEKMDKKNQIIILDLSLLPFELLETITGLIGRLILEFTQRINKVEDYKNRRGEYPIALILEEAQNYIPEVDKNGKKSITKRVFERIAREGRKFGVSLIISSQRPSELSKTILSQCNTFIVHKLQNPEDQRYIRQIVSSANEELLNQLPILPQQHAIIMGEAVRTPSQVRINDITKKPDSNNPKFIEQWLKGKSEIEIKPVTDKWLDIDEKNKNNEENRENE